MGEENRNNMENHGSGTQGSNQNGSQNGSGGDNRRNNTNKSIMLICLVSSLIMTFGLFYIMKTHEDGMTKEITYDEFVTMLEEDKLSKVEISADTGMLILTPRNKNMMTRHILLLIIPV